MTGRNIVNAMKMRKTPEARSKPKYMRDFPEGTLLVADWKLPGKSLTPFETLYQKQWTVNKEIKQFSINAVTIRIYLD